ncbi:MAG: restriction-modification system protein, partial [Neobacillus sp.]|nr:restriction-modification system protein [Neobacillus sp.]
TEEKITHLGLKNSSAKIVPAGTILLALYGATAGVIAITKIDTAINQAILAITPVYQINTLFLMVSLENQMQIAIGKYTQGGQPNFNAGIIKKLEISIPDIEEQNAIAKVFSSADCEIELLEQELLQWQAKKRSLQQLLLTGIVRV